MSNDIVFRRIHGRIVAIKKKHTEGPGMVKEGTLSKRERQVKSVVAPTLIAGGLGVAVGAGRIAQSMVRESARLENISRGTIKGLKGIPRSARGAAGAAAISQRVRSLRLFKGRLGVLYTGKALAAGMVSVGLGEAVEAVRGKTSGAIGELAGHVTGGIVGGLALAAYYKGLGGKGAAHAFKSVYRNMAGITARTARIKKGFY